MKILHVQAQLPAKTGSGVYFSNLIKGLKNMIKLVYMALLVILAMI